MLTIFGKYRKKEENHHLSLGRPDRIVLCSWKVDITWESWVWFLTHFLISLGVIGLFRLNSSWIDF